NTEGGELWVDNKDRVRRLLADATTVELYDFGASTPPITAPSSVSSDTLFCRGLVNKPATDAGGCDEGYVKTAIDLFRTVNGPSARPSVNDLINGKLADTAHAGNATIEYAQDGTPAVHC